MARTRTFVDSGVLIAAFRGEASIAERAFSVLGNPQLDLITSEFVKLELLPKAICYKRHEETEFYQAFFHGAKRLVRASQTLVAEAQREAETYGLSAIDALHVAAAKRAGCNEFVTTESETKPLFRVTGLIVRSIRLAESPKQSGT